MYKKGIEVFPYYLGVSSLADVATRADRVCVLNILGGESRQVTPVSHTFSGGNVACGTSPGRRGQVLSTEAGDIPVYNNVREALDEGIAFKPPESTVNLCSAAIFRKIDPRWQRSIKAVIKDCDPWRMCGATGRRATWQHADRAEKRQGDDLMGGGRRWHASISLSQCKSKRRTGARLPPRSGALAEQSNRAEGDIH